MIVEVTAVTRTKIVGEAWNKLKYTRYSNKLFVTKKNWGNFLGPRSLYINPQQIKSILFVWVQKLKNKNFTMINVTRTNVNG